MSLQMEINQNLLFPWLNQQQHTKSKNETCKLSFLFSLVQQITIQHPFM